MPMIYDNEIVRPPIRGCIYGDPKTCKTPLICAMLLDSKYEPYIGEAVYVAADDGSESLMSVPMEARKRLHIVKPMAEPCAPCKGEGSIGAKECASCKGTGRGKYDPAHEAFTIAMTDWRKRWPKVRTLIWDTMSETSKEILAHIADTGQFSGDSADGKKKDKHIMLGEPDSPAFQNIPMMGDYMAAQGVVERLTKMLFKSPLNLFVLYHSDVDEKDNGTIVAGGPATIGKATIRSVAKPYDFVLRVEKKSAFDAKEKRATQEIHIHSEASGVWIGGVRVAGTNPMPLVKVAMDRPFAPYWPMFYDKFYPHLLDPTAAPAAQS
jgi:hypothetical protein